MGNTFGHLFAVTTWGESHGQATGAVIDGCPPRLPLTAAMVQHDLDRRRPGQSDLTTARREPDRIEIVSGLAAGETLGSPIAMWVRSHDARPGDYGELADVYRPSHADYTTEAKYGIRAAAGGGRASARETVGRVAAGAVARQLLAVRAAVEIVGWVAQVQDVGSEVDAETVTQGQVDATPVRCPDPAAAAAMVDRIAAARQAGDSVGGVVAVAARGVPAGLGEPVFDKLEADLGRALLSIPACRGFEVGSGFAGAAMTGSRHNDAYYRDGARVRTRTNRSGGIQGGISNGETILVRAGFKPTATIGRAQQTVDAAGQERTLTARGRHDPCVLPRAVPICEAMVALVLADHLLRQAAIACR